MGYSVHRAASVNISFETAVPIIDSAFASWNKAICPNGSAAGIALSNVGTVACGETRYNPNGPNQNVVIFRDQAWPYSDASNTLGLTTLTFDADTGEIYDADMELNTASGKVTASTLLGVVTHEAGHFLGLGHATDANARMFANNTSGSSLGEDDIAGVCAIYPNLSGRSVDASVCASGVVAAAACDPTPRHGFGSGCAENSVLPDGGGALDGGTPAVQRNCSDGGASTMSGITRSSGGCALGPGPTGTGSAFVIALALALAAGARRRRRAGELPRVARRCASACRPL